MRQLRRGQVAVCRPSGLPGDRRGLSRNDRPPGQRPLQDAVLDRFRPGQSEHVGRAACDRCSRAGYVFNIAGGAVAWASFKQNLVATSTTHAEYVGQDAAARELEFLVNLLKELQLTVAEHASIFGAPTKILGTRYENASGLPRLFGDNQGAIKLAFNPVFHKLSKHFAIKFHYVRSLIRNRIIHIQHVPGKDNPADIMTKSLPRPAFEKHRSGMGMVDVGS